MRGVGSIKSCGFKLSHGYNLNLVVNKVPLFPLYFKLFCTYHSHMGKSKMAQVNGDVATVNGETHWSAVRVRETFLEYFKKNGHTFGGQKYT